MIERLASPPDAVRALREKGLDARTWSAGPRDHFPLHSHARAKRLFVLRGAITFNGMQLEAPAGIRIPAGFEHSADAGPYGVECVEAFE